MQLWPIQTQLSGIFLIKQGYQLCLGFLNNAVQAGDPIYVSSISLIEIAYLVEKGRFQEDLFAKLNTQLSTFNADLIAINVTLEMPK